MNRLRLELFYVEKASRLPITDFDGVETHAFFVMSFCRTAALVGNLQRVILDVLEDVRKFGDKDF